jgi:4-amino-4-deoxy-L-arabinose transferase-like glycosyltransferase
MTWFPGSRKTLTFVVSLAFVLAFGLRMVDLTDLPLDFNPGRQLFSMLKARGMYYALSPELPAWQREIAIQQWQETAVIEPPVLEALVAVSYRAFGEHLEIPRIYSSIFWLVGGLFLFLLARQMTGAGGALIALLFYLFLPFGVYASRSFQPDPLMVALICAALWGMWNWREHGSWRYALTAGLLTGAAIFVKNVAVFPLGVAAMALVLEWGLVAALKDRQTWVVALLAVLPVALYTLYGVAIAGYLGGQFDFRFFPNLWPTAAFYLQWKNQLEGVFGFSLVLLGLAGMFAARRRVFALLAGLWIGYFLYGMTFAYHITSHDYYQLLLMPTLALSLAVVAEILFEHAAALRNLRLARAVIALGLLAVVAVEMWTVRVELVRQDYRPDAAYQWSIGEVLGHTSTPVVSLAQDYGGRLAYWGWQPNVAWYDESMLVLRDLAGRDIDLAGQFPKMIEGKRFFVVTHLAELERQAYLKDVLYSNYPVYAEGKGYVIFDLAHPKNSTP